MKWTNLQFWKSKTYFDLIDRMDEHVLPPAFARYRAFDCTPFESVRVVILGQDPYHTPGMADGLAFSVLPGVKPYPPSLNNIFKEYQDDLGFPRPESGSLMGWAEQGVLLLNTVLSVEKGKPNSHRGIGWERLTHEIIRTLSEEHTGLVFNLWGKQAQEYRGLIDETKHMVLCSPHPSPYSASTGFFGSKPFSSTNNFLDKPINWRL